MSRITKRSRSSRLTLLRGHGTPDGGHRAAEGSETAVAELPQKRPPLRLVPDPPRDILLAGGDAVRRDALVRELSQRLPEGTPIRQAEATWQVLEQAPSSRLVMLAGELEGTSAESVMHMLGSRHPQLPVVALGAPAAC